MSHAVEQDTLQTSLYPLVGEGAGGQETAEGSFPAREGGFHQAAVMIPAGSFPRGPAELSNGPKGFISGEGDLGAIPMLDDLGVPARRDDGLYLLARQGPIDLGFVIGSIPDQPLYRGLDLLQQRLYAGGIIHSVRRHLPSYDLLTLCVQSEMQLAPGASLAPSMLTDFPFPLPIHLQPRTVHHHVPRTVPSSRRKVQGQLPLASGSSGVVRNSQG